MAEVIKLRPAEDPDEVLKRAAEESIFDEVLVIGWTKSGAAQMRSSLGLEAGDIQLLIAIAQRMLLDEVLD